MNSWAAATVTVTHIQNTFIICLSDHIIRFHCWLSVTQQGLLTHRVWIKLVILSSGQQARSCRSELCRRLRSVAAAAQVEAGRATYLRWAEAWWDTQHLNTPQLYLGHFQTHRTAAAAAQTQTLPDVSWRNKSWTSRRTSYSKCKKVDPDIQDLDFQQNIPLFTW